ncbi:MAG: 6-phosphofructo-2-kinase/fructose-2,6-bisphosphatase [Polyangiaceae bacterium]|nr:6-phosphofructo-2-kinase/fructose-2,6-bisphosphatase [Myxococcales bacterium]MCB9583912.1 6-phosphofructo-2-kinase/fructose-2,6-bisphosphatase [Polyangiaceae bacterium]MCB9607832.1 6-phosphofructo-2-kinase/fructose-2,6-bisphosphatase [Polyangiaceae bacterium]
MPPQDPHTPPIALVMVGLPARGKTYISRKISRYLSWLGYQTRVFNVGNYRRARLGAAQAHAFFDPTNAEGVEARRQLAMAALRDMLKWLKGGGQVGIYDATNTTRGRRRLVLEECDKAGVQVVFVESICDSAVVEANIREVKLGSPDYVDMTPEEAAEDFRARIAHYERSYEPLDDPELAYVKLIDVGRQVVVNGVEGYLCARLVFFLMNIHTDRRTIWLTRHGESEYNVENRIGGDPELTALGKGYAKNLAAYIQERVPTQQEFVLWTSTLRRTWHTAEPIGREVTQWRVLDEIDAGECDGMTYDEIRRERPEEFRARAEDKLRYRYPRGESYSDVIQRLEPVIVELERQKQPVLVVSHQGIIRGLYGYLIGRPQEECPHIQIPLHTLIEMTPTAYGYEERRIKLGPELG